MKRIRFLCTLIACAAAFSAEAADSGHRQHERMLFADMEPVVFQPGPFQSGPFQSGGVSLDQAISMMQTKYGARVMRANTVEEDGKRVHYIRLMTPDRSRVWTVRVDAATGREF